MKKRRLVGAAALVVAIACAFGAWRLIAHAKALAIPAVITPAMDARAAYDPSLRDRYEALLREHGRNPGPHPKLIALTFDDGPYPVFTPLLLAQLQHLKVPATFFLIGRDAREWPGLTRRIAAAGDEIGDHTLTHPDLDRETDARAAAEILGGRDALWSLVRDPAVRSYVRPPHGRYNEATIQVAQRLGYTMILWNDDAGDWRALAPGAISRHLVEHASAPDIVLLHSGRLATVEALPEVVARFRSAGYRFVTVGQLLARASAAVVNRPLRRAV